MDILPLTFLSRCFCNTSAFAIYEPGLRESFGLFLANHSEQVPSLYRLSALDFIRVYQRGKKTLEKEKKSEPLVLFACTCTSLELYFRPDSTSESVLNASMSSAPLRYLALRSPPARLLRSTQLATLRLTPPKYIDFTTTTVKSARTFSLAVKKLQASDKDGQEATGGSGHHEESFEEFTARYAIQEQSLFYFGHLAIGNC